MIRQSWLVEWNCKPNFKERIDKSIVGKLINAAVNFGLGAPIKGNKNPKIY